mgnify:CR=1 FL=1
MRKLGELSEKTLEILKEKGALRESLIQERLKDNRARCGVCQRLCVISSGGSGYCKTVVNIEGTLYTTIYGVISSAAADPIEKKPVFHYKPGSLCYSVGSLGCSFRCVFCQNWQIAYADGLSADGICRYGVSAETLVAAAKRTGCEGVAWTYNEPAIWLNYTLDCAKLAKESGLYTVYVTNGSATEAHIDMIAPYLDVYRVDIKSMSDDFYRKLIKLPSSKGIRDMAIRALNKGMHIECVTNVIPGWNDSEHNLRETARWIADNLGGGTPWHVTRFFPYAKLADVPPTPMHTLERAAQIGREEGLKFVYLGNVVTAEGENTYCPTCGNLMIKRAGFDASIVGVTPEGRCKYDGAELGIVM